MAIDLRTSLSHALGVELSSTVAFDHPTIPALARFVQTHVLAEARPVQDDPRADHHKHDSAPPLIADEQLPEMPLDELIAAAKRDLAMGV
jgi:hypothetical protein